MANFIRRFVVLFVVAFTVSGAYSAAEAAPLSADTRAKLESIRASIETWAPMVDGAIALNRTGYQGDIIEYAGYRCIGGDTERCNDIRRGQDADGRWWRAPKLIHQETGDSFSRDMFMGLMYYFTKTRDTVALDRWLNYLKSHGNKMCDDASDNRCTLMPSTWGLLGHTLQYLGYKPTLKMKLGAQILPAEMLISAATAPKGFELVLLADNLFFLRSLGYNATWMQKVAKIALKRQPENPLFQYLVNGPTEQLGQLLLEACPAEPSEKGDDVFWQRELARNDQGQLIIIRDDWGADNSRIPVRRMVNGHDCIIAMNFLLRAPF